MIKRIALVAALLLAMPSQAQEADPPTLEAQLDQWLAWFPGTYDSLPQTLEQAEAGLPEDGRNYRRHSIFTRVDLPRFGEITFYAEQRRWLADAPPEGEVYRQRIYVISLDEEREAIRLRVYVPHDQESLLGAWRDPSLLDGLDPEATVNWAGCDLFWTWEGDHFIGRLDPGACTFQSAAYGQRIQLEEYLLLAEDEMHFADRGLSMDGEYLFGMRGDTPTIARRVVETSP
ncbi:chromophore lyase CpcT/CpeT [Erythrobacter sp. HA6-11]